MHDLIKYLTEWELELVEGISSNLQSWCIIPSWWLGWTGQYIYESQNALDEFLLEPYKEIYGYYHSHGVELVIHLSWQLRSNTGSFISRWESMYGRDVWKPIIFRNCDQVKYGGKISFMGVSKIVQLILRAGQMENCDAVVRRVCEDRKQILYSMYRSGWPWFCLSGCL